MSPSATEAPTAATRDQAAPHKTPTKLGRKAASPQSAKTAPKKLEEQASKTSTTAKFKDDDQKQPQALDSKPKTASKPDVSNVTGQTVKATSAAEPSKDVQTSRLRQKVQQAKHDMIESERKRHSGITNSNDSEELHLQHAEPIPVSDQEGLDDTNGDTDKAAEGVKPDDNAAHDTDKDATSKAERTADDTSKAKESISTDSKDASTEHKPKKDVLKQQQPQTNAGGASGIFQGARGLAGRASAIVSKAARKPQQATETVLDDDKSYRQQMIDAEAGASDARDTADGDKITNSADTTGTGKASQMAGSDSGYVLDEAGHAGETAGRDNEAEDGEDIGEDDGEETSNDQNPAEPVNGIAHEQNSVDSAQSADDSNAVEDVQIDHDQAGDTGQAQDGATGEDGAIDEVKEISYHRDGDHKPANKSAERHEQEDDGKLKDGDESADGLPEDMKQEDLPLDFSILKGLEVQSDGRVLDQEGNAIAYLAEGDAEDLEGYPIGDNAEILDEDGDLVGRIELLPEEIKRQLQKANHDGVELPEHIGEYLAGLSGEEDEQDDGNEPLLPSLSILEGLTCGLDGIIFDEEGNTVGVVTDGDPDEMQHHKLNAEGEFVDDAGNVVGTAKIHDEAALLVEKGVYEAEGAGQGEGDDAIAGAEDMDADEAQESAGEEEHAAIEDELPGIEALRGKELNEIGQIVDEEGNVVAQIQNEELKQKVESGEIDPETLHIDEAGEVVDQDDKVLSSTQLLQGAAERLAGIAPSYDIRILEGRKVNKKGKVLDDDGEEIGQLVEGETSQCTGKTINGKGEVVDKKGKVLGKVKVSDGEAAQEATRLFFEDLDEASDEQLPGLDILDGLKVNKKGQILNEDGEPIGELVEGELSDCVGKKCNAEGDVLDKHGRTVGRVRTLAPPTEEPKEVGEQPVEQGAESQETHPEQAAEDENKSQGELEEDAGLPPPLSILEGYAVNKSGNILDDKGNIIGELIEGDAKRLSKLRTTCDAEGQFWDNKGRVVGRVKTVEQEDADEEPPFAGLEKLKVVEGGWIEDGEGNRVGQVTEGNAKKLTGRSVDEDGDILDKRGSVVGHAERYEEEEVPEEQAVDLPFLYGKTVNKSGLVMYEGIPVARVVKGNVKEMANRKLDDKGQVWNDSGKVIGRVDLIPEDERESKPEGPFAGLDGLRAVKGAKVADGEGNVVGEIVEGNVKRMIGLAVDEDGDILDKYGNVKGHAVPWEEPEELEEASEDLSALAKTTINKAGNAVDANGLIIGHVVEGNVKRMIGKKVDGQGQIWDNAGNVVGRCELSAGEDGSQDGPFAGFEGLRVQKDGTVTTQAGDIVGKILDGDVKRLVGHSVDEDGDILDKNGNRIGRAERWELEEKERRKNAMSGMRVNREGEVRDTNGDLIGRLTDGRLGHCVGQEIDDNGNVVDQDGNKIGEATLLENIVEDEYEGPSHEELEEARKRDQEREVAKKMATICTQTLERMQPICKQITEHMEAADRTPKDELDEEDLVNKVKPLIEEGGRILQECNGSLRGLDPDGHIAAQAKGRAGTGEATPEEHRLADTLKELTSTVVTTIDNAKKKLNDMPHAKKKLNPLWALLTQPLFQILAAVGLLLAGVLGLVGQLLNGLGLGGLVNGLLGGLGIDKLLQSFGLGGGAKGKKKSLIGGLLGGK